MTQSATNASEAAAYYDADEVAAFYRLCWGGADIHIGRYDTGCETVAEASLAMTRYLLSLAKLRERDRVLDIACGYGGTLRELARLGCNASGIDISQVCVDEARRANDEAGLSKKVSVEVGDFHDIQSPDAVYDACVCQESIIHSTNRPRVFAEVLRVLKSGGVFAFSDILTAENADLALVNAAFERLGVQGGATPADYRRMAEEAGFEIEHAEERPGDIKTHYAKLAEQLETPPAGLSDDTVETLKASIQRWRTALAGRHITWACFIARKPQRT
ncbi:SAM-dependent methyltransferase [Ovoidimarina sediminis]|uniref:SAM-dependent methyltransferase n=1 Tax=Ovoidimarina sediminis TaxID=3079856 RepID=UPI002907D6FF|nr:methyltransferase domain-containing protein [Rhodophyticola sp. MJ-SS7]MDU8945944.1 methyltransferase domain-containing protein [Rhodophyticola sp. MJ-SS7]